jgi:hypothetical protein
MNTISKIRANFDSFEDVFLFVRIFIFLTMIPPFVKYLSLPHLMKVCTANSISDGRDMEKYEDKIIRYTDFILSKNLWIYRVSCLKRSLALYHFLGRLGLKLQICFGVKFKTNLSDTDSRKELEGHAWLLRDGRIYLEKNLEMTKTYKTTYCFPERLA